MWQYDLKCHGNSERNAHGELRKGDLVDMEGIQGRRESIPDHGLHVSCPQTNTENRGKKGVLIKVVSSV